MDIEDDSDLDEDYTPEAEKKEAAKVRAAKRKAPGGDTIFAGRSGRGGVPAPQDESFLAGASAMKKRKTDELWAEMNFASADNKKVGKPKDGKKKKGKKTKEQKKAKREEVGEQISCAANFDLVCYS
jgi:hypothetical protein